MTKGEGLNEIRHKDLSKWSQFFYCVTQDQHLALSFGCTMTLSFIKVFFRDLRYQSQSPSLSLVAFQLKANNLSNFFGVRLSRLFVTFYKVDRSPLQPFLKYSNNNLKYNSSKSRRMTMKVLTSSLKHLWSFRSFPNFALCIISFSFSLSLIEVDLWNAQFCTCVASFFFCVACGVAWRIFQEKQVILYRITL